MPLNTINDLHLEKYMPADMGKITGLSAVWEGWLGKGRDDGPPRSGGIHASEIHGCERKIVYSILGKPRSSTHIPVVWKKRFEMGHAVHNMLQKQFHQMANDSDGTIEFDDEVRISPERQPMAEKWQIYSSCDGIFTFRENRDAPPTARLGLEIKTISPTSFTKLNKPEPGHVEQAHVYMACLDLPMVWFLYWDKGYQNTTGTNLPAFMVKFDLKVWQKLEEKFDRLHAMAMVHRLPDRKESMICEFCSYASICQPECWKRSQGNKHIHTRWEQQ